MLRVYGRPLGERSLLAARTVHGARYRTISVAANTQPVAIRQALLLFLKKLVGRQVGGIVIQTENSRRVERHPFQANGFTLSRRIFCALASLRHLPATSNNSADAAGNTHELARALGQP